MSKNNDTLDTIIQKNLSYRENLTKEMISKISSALEPFAFIMDIKIFSNPNSSKDIYDPFTIIFLCSFSPIFIDFNKKYILDHHLKDLNVVYTYPKQDAAEFYIFFSSDLNYSYIQQLLSSDNMKEIFS
ncbi:MAG: hypothetical protein ACP5Q5_00535 [Brevinematia bacterium]